MADITKKSIFKRPYLEYTNLADGATAPESDATWTNIPNDRIVGDEITVTPSDGTVHESKDNNGQNYHYAQDDPTYVVEFSTFEEETALIAHSCYAVRVSNPSTGTGKVFDNCYLAKKWTLDSSGSKYSYKLGVQIPEDGEVIKDYTKA